jgi:hypothetical protein
MKSSKLLGIVIALQVLLLIGQWVAPSGNVARADVPLPNPSERQLAMLDELKTLNGKMDHLVGLLESGKVEVKVARSDKK